MATTPIRAEALLPTEPPPPLSDSRVRQAASTIMLAVFIAGLLPGVVLGMVIGPPLAERCNSAPDPIACLIVTLD